MNAHQWKQRLQKWRGEEPLEEDLTSYRLVLDDINRREENLAGETDARLQEIAASSELERKKARVWMSCLLRFSLW